MFWYSTAEETFSLVYGLVISYAVIMKNIT